jgi:two-component system chemotaxis response regulator CheB
MPAISETLIRRGAKIRVLVVDDSVVIRRLVAHALEEEAAIEVVGTAANGSIALARIEQLNPDVVTLDIEMPEMNGLEALRRIRKQYPKLRVIMFSTLTERGAAITLEALTLGADDYVTKAANIGSLDRSLANLRAELIPRIRQFFRVELRPAPLPALSGTIKAGQSPAQPVSRGGSQPKVVAIGVSTGGPTALGKIVPQLPPDFPLPVLIVQHMPPLFTRLLAERLQSSTELKVNEAAEGSPVEPGRVLIAPGDYHMRVRKTGARATVTLDQSAPENSCRPAVDVMLHSVAEVYGDAAICAILTGMGQDGLRGAQMLKANGARVIAQDENSSVVWGMPGAVVTAGLADSVVPLEDVVPEILRWVGRG